MAYTHVTARNRKGAEKQANLIKKAVYNNKFTITDIIYVKGSKKRNYEGKMLKRYGIVLRKKKR